MAYQPGNVPAGFDPLFFQQELNKIREAMTGQVPFAYLEPQAVANPKPREGMIVLADGTHWDPGSGAGYYGYQGGVWVPLSGKRDHGQCVLRLSSSTELRLYPKNGNGIIVGDKQFRIPLAGVPLAATGLTAGTPYYAFAKDNGSGALALEAAAVASSGHTTYTNGVEIKTGDPSRTLVGAFVPGAGPIFLDSTTQRRVASWFNERPRAMYEYINTATASATMVGIGAAYTAFMWAGKDVLDVAEGETKNTVASTGNYLGIYVNGASINTAIGYTMTTANFQYPAGTVAPYAVPADGLYTFQIFARVNGGGTGTFELNHAMTLPG